MSDKVNEPSFFSNLWERRFFQFFATYIAASWGAIQFLEWGVTRYGLPSAWVDKLVVLLLALLPFVCCVIYFHGRVGDDQWLKFEKVFYPINIIGALMISMFLVDSSATEVTQEVVLTDLDGEEIIREIPKEEYNKRIVVFPVEGAKKTTWEGVGISELLNNKLEQDMRIIVASAMSIDDSYEHYGYEKFTDIPFTTKMKIATDNYSNFFVESKFVDEENRKVEVKVFNSENGQEVSQAVVEGVDIYELTENMSDEINSRIKLTEVEGKELYVDFPASNMLSADTTALRLYIQSGITTSKEPGNLPKIYELIERAVEKDPTCAECWSRFAYTKMLSGKDQGNEMENALKYVESLPERQQLSIKYFNYLSKDETENTINLCKMWRKLYPQDSKPVSNLINLYSGYLRPDEAKQVAKEAIADGHKGSIYLTYANMLIQSKDWEEAEIYLKKYKDTYPKQFEATSLLVDTYAGKGQMNEALEALDELILMSPNEKKYLLKKAQLLSKQNDFSGGLDILNDALKSTEIPTEIITNYTTQLQIYQRAMKFEEYGGVRRKLKAVYTKNFPPITYLQTEYSTVGYYNFIGHVDSIEYHIKDIASSVAPSRRELVKDLNVFMIKLFSGDSTNIEQSYEKVRPMFDRLGSEFINLLYQSEIKFAQKKYEEALVLFHQFKEVTPTIDMISNNFHETHLILGRNKEGLTLVNDMLKDDPLNPLFLYYKSKFLVNLDKKAEAKETFAKVVDIFRDADPRYTYAKDALELANKLGL